MGSVPVPAPARPVPPDGQDDEDNWDDQAQPDLIRAQTSSTRRRRNTVPQYRVERVLP